MKANPLVNLEGANKYFENIFDRLVLTDFIRKGKTGSWKAEMSPEMIAKHKWILANQLEWD
jgi:hypothetical protein